MQKKFFRSNPWLSHKVRKERDLLFPQLRFTFAQKLRGGLYWLLRAKVFWGIVAWALILSSQFLLIKTYPSFAEFFQLSELNYSNLLDVLIGALATLLGIGIPILILVVDNVSSKRANYLLPSFLRASGIIQTAELGLVILAVLIGSKFIFSLSLIYDSQLSFPIAFTLTFATLVVLMGLIRIVWGMNNLFSNTYMDEKLSTTLSAEIQHHLSNEINYRLAKSLCQTLYSQLGFHHYLGVGYTRDYHAIYWQKSGRIIDINFHLLQDALNDQRIQTVAQLPRGWYTKKAFDEVSKGEIAFYVRCKEEHLSEIRRSLLAPFKISPKIRSSGNISAVMDLLKNRALEAIRQGIVSDYRTALARYCEILGNSAELPVIADSATPLSSWGKWNITFLAIMDLRTIAEVSAQNPQEEYIRRLAWSLSEVMTNTLLNSKQDHTGEIPAILDLYPAIYHFCFKHSRPLFANAAYEPLMDTFLDPHEFWAIKHGQPSLSQYIRRKGVYFQTIRTIGIILRNAIDNQDFVHTKTILQNLTLGELGMNMFHNSRWARDEWIITPLSQNAGLKETEELNEELEIRKAVNIFPNELDGYIRSIRFAAAAYVIEGVFQGLIQPSSGFQLIEPIWKSNDSLEQFTELFLYQCEHYAMSSWSLFDRTPDTKQVFSPNFEQKFFYYFVLKGIDILAKNGLTSPNYGTINFPGMAARTKETSDLILQQWDEKWKPIIGKQKTEAKRLVKILLGFIGPPIKVRSASLLFKKIKTKKNP